VRLLIRRGHSTGCVGEPGSGVNDKGSRSSLQPACLLKGVQPAISLSPKRIRNACTSGLRAWDNRAWDNRDKRSGRSNNGLQSTVRC
jgi:hypothetical protein